MNTFSVREALTFGWETFKKRPFLFVGAFALTMLVSGIVSAILDPEQGAPVTLITSIMSVLSALIGLFIELGLVTFSIRSHDSVEKVSLYDFWNPAPFLRYLGGQILLGLIVIIGIILLIVPGVIAALGLMFTPYLIIERNRGPIEALKESWRITMGHKKELFFFMLALIGINILGLLALVVGLLVSVPVSMLAMVHVYRKLEHSASKVAPLPTA